MYKIRFHLQEGKNYKKWQIKSPSGAVSFHEPSEVTIFMEGCLLRNQPNGAKKIFGGNRKSVVAWVDAKEVTVVQLPIKNIMSTSTILHYNPRVVPYWSLEGENVDKTTYPNLFTSNRHIIKPKIN